VQLHGEVLRSIWRLVLANRRFIERVVSVRGGGRFGGGGGRSEGSRSCSRRRDLEGDPLRVVGGGVALSGRRSPRRQRVGLEAGGGGDHLAVRPVSRIRPVVAASAASRAATGSASTPTTAAATSGKDGCGVQTRFFLMMAHHLVVVVRWGVGWLLRSLASACFDLLSVSLSSIARGSPVLSEMGPDLI